jgi:hypothetical protein
MESREESIASALEGPHRNGLPSLSTVALEIASIIRPAAL